MGGNALGPAVRLTTTQHAALERYCRQKLSGHFEVMASLAYLRSKEMHGDLDLICGWEGCEVGKFEKGLCPERVQKVTRRSGSEREAKDRAGVEFHVSREEAGQDTGRKSIQTGSLDAGERGAAKVPNKVGGKSDARGRGATVREMTLPDLLQSAVRALGGTGWKSRSNEVQVANVAVPVAVFNDVRADKASALASSGRIDEAESISEGWEATVRELGCKTGTTQQDRHRVLERVSTDLFCRETNDILTSQDETGDLEVSESRALAVHVR